MLSSHIVHHTRTDDRAVAREVVVEMSDQGASDEVGTATAIRERQQARQRVQARRDFASHVVAYVVINAFLIGAWALTGGGYFWPAWVLAGWGAGLVLHAVGAAAGAATVLILRPHRLRVVPVTKATVRASYGLAGATATGTDGIARALITGHTGGATPQDGPNVGQAA
jgi:hypothetical protein